MSPTKIQGAEHTIGAIFSSHFFFEIADYQRPYAWETEQAGELLEDLMTFGPLSNLTWLPLRYMRGLTYPSVCLARVMS